MRSHRLQSQIIARLTGALALFLGLAACSSGGSSYVPAAATAAASPSVAATATPEPLPSKDAATCVNCGTNSHAVGS